MTYDTALIERIVAEVIGRLRPETERSRPTRPGLLLVYPGEFESQAVAVVEKELQAGWNVYHAQIEEMEHVSLHRDVKRLVFLQTDQDLLMRGALGLTGTVASQLLAEGLLRGLPALLVPCSSLKWLLDVRAGEAVLSPAAKRYRQHIRTHAAELGAFGATLGSMADVLALADTFVEEEVTGESMEGRTSRSERTTVFEGKVLTQNDVQQAKERVLYVSSSTVVTPLARDAARTNGVTIQVDER
ncbi:hypothetical protein [Aneurinibacillus aneurinilyticus]|uniref:Uncharacterized protein n=1 Tax=Aneurinibacillus aneurinilyticus ATCC 12856 TaxID=649747 RepID=U1W744_ANEAE|nr:hypothetical protein [Aneurinibacillus aneurinilyticus]ERI04284.1 hypothetical protein HMPREF0083_06118 [Aneurinibacillus aneurinilyticus ATCC 12856]MED0708333.1 hypothetical protein [Aneurinibacillus aneurinilyticus]MED0722079.1 hypothetical protein [Aneurinibacillus aneurinilyticus]MED0733361.1 hypothetical protein [Aneurinibacillus aneurinilyticus]MED0741385.1 hypothetical protein [Aneurinibacillus aneurinilyticus]